MYQHYYKRLYVSETEDETQSPKWYWVAGGTESGGGASDAFGLYVL